MRRSDEVERQLIATLFDQQGVLVAGHIALFVAAIASWFESGQSWFLAWAAAIAIVLVGRLPFERHFHPARRRCTVEISRLVHRTGCWATGILLGCGALVFVIPVGPGIQLLVLATETVFIMGGAGRNAASKANAKGQILLGIVPLFATCLLTAKVAYMLVSVAILFELFAGVALVEYLNARLVRMLVLIEENSDLIVQLERAAATDSLTGIANRRRFDTVLSAATRRAEREHAYLALLLLDIDFFKGFNDLYGHQAGDDCLQRVAALLATSFTRSGDLVARYGGEEFVAVLPGIDPLQAESLAEAVRANVVALAIPYAFGREGIVTVSIGVVAALPHHDVRPEDFVRAADAALYTAKAEGRNCIRSAAGLVAMLAVEKAKPQTA
jgi:diguanylate cyclase (GGDEF)-like protein